MFPTSFVARRGLQARVRGRCNEGHNRKARAGMQLRGIVLSGKVLGDKEPGNKKDSIGNGQHRRQASFCAFPPPMNHTG